MIGNKYKDSFGGDKSVPKLDCSAGCLTLNIINTELWTLKGLIIVCKL